MPLRFFKLGLECFDAIAADSLGSGSSFSAHFLLPAGNCPNHNLRKSGRRCDRSDECCLA